MKMLCYYCGKEATHKTLPRKFVGYSGIQYSEATYVCGEHKSPSDLPLKPNGQNK